MVEPVGVPAAELGVLWAKLGRGEAPGYHPLACHLADVGAVASALWNGVLPTPTRVGVAAALGVDEDAAGRWVACWAGLHDLGKASPSFQGQDNASRRRVETSGYPFGSFPSSRSVPHGAITAATLPAALAATALPDDVVRRVATAIGGHHGIFPRSIDRASAAAAAGKGRWREARHALADRLLVGLDRFAAPQRLEPATAIWLAGFVSVADWIGSDAEYFPFAAPDPAVVPPPPNGAYGREAARRAMRALDGLGWTAWRAPPGVRPFAGLFPGLTPNSTQAAAVALGERSTGPTLAVVEAPMGEGKTEAALYLADRWGAAAGRAGLYVALPTRATSDQMFNRVRGFLTHRYPTEIVNIQLLHGLASLSGEFAELRRNADRLLAPREIYAGEAGAIEGGVVAAEWFTHRKRGLLAPFGVGTVDQALLAVLQTRHGFVRLFGLAGKTVVVDEIHAYDAYMSTLLERLLEWLAALGSAVVLLSATLPAARRRALLAAYARGLGRTLDHAALATTAYPRLSWVDAAGAGERAVAASERGTKAVGIVWVPGDDADLAARLRAKLAAGGCAVVVCNTVARAQDLYRALRPLFPGRADDGGPELDLLHARYLFEDRREREHRTLRRFGKAGEMVAGERVRRPGRAVLVATQIVEQSLDLDFDLLVTDPAPADLVLQRLGRLHRHPGRERHALASPEVWLRAPDEPDGLPRFDPGTAAVYDEHVLLRSWLALRHRSSLRVPDDVAELVEAVYDDGRSCPAGADAALRERWEETRRGLVARRERDEATAKLLSILPPDYPDDLFEDDSRELEEDDPALHPSLQALTRLGDRSVAVVCLTPEQRVGFRPSEVPTVAAAEALLNRSVSLGDRRVVDDLERLPVPSGWRRSPLLRHHRLLELDADGGCLVGKYRIVRKDDVGMFVAPSEEEGDRV